MNERTNERMRKKREIMHILNKKISVFMLVPFSFVAFRCVTTYCNLFSLCILGPLSSVQFSLAPFRVSLCNVPFFMVHMEFLFIFTALCNAYTSVMCIWIAVPIHSGGSERESNARAMFFHKLFPLWIVESERMKCKKKAHKRIRWCYFIHPNGLVYRCDWYFETCILLTVCKPR